MTSNIGTAFVKSGGTLGFLREDGLSAQERQLRENIESDLKRTFRPEFLNRIDEIITFSPLSKDEMGLIVELQMKEVAERLKERGLQVELTENARLWLANEGFDPAFGARPLKRALQKHVESPLSVDLLAGVFTQGDKVIVDLDETTGKLVFQRLGQGIPAELGPVAAES
jgi:ATP-dependent Clp protease ATP-binding subunit ClpC